MKGFGTTLGAYFVFLVGCLMSVSGQTDVDSFYTKEGKLVTELNTSVLSEEFNLVGYRLEVIDLPVSGDKKIDDLPLQRAFRIVVVSSRDLPKMRLYSVWLGDLNQLDAYLTQSNELSAVIFAKTLPSGDLTIGLSKRGARNPEERVVFPGTLYVPPDYATPADELETTTPIIKLKRLPKTIELRVEYSRGGCFDQMTGLPRYSTLEIEGFETTPRRITFMCDGHHFVGYFSPEEFARIPNGANIIKKVVDGNNVSKKVVGRLDKSTIR